MGIRYKLFVAVGTRPRAFWTDAAELAAAWSPEEEPPPPDEDLPDALAELLWWLRLPTTPPTTAAMMTAIKTGIPNLIQLLVRFFIGTGVI